MPISPKPVSIRPISPKRARGERGSALLVVLVFAAVIAIMLYRELPIAAFEAQRQKEELLVSRGNEYKRGVKLFVRKMGRFPSTIDELENTNRMRFLRHRYVDPFTGKEDWRLIHAGPGGIILDSKVATANTNKNASTLGQGATFAGFNNSFSGDTAAAAAQAAENTPSAGLRQRPPATKNAASASTDPLAAVAGTADAPLDPDNPNPPLPNGQSNSSVANSVNTLADQLNNTNPKTPETAPAQAQQSQGLGNTSAFGSSTSAFGNSASGQPQNGQNGVVGNQGATVGNGQTTGGGIAGVASIAEGKGIKLVNDQKKYKLWEFYYDLRKEQNQNAPGLGQGQGQNAGANGQGTSTFGNSSFGNSSSFGSNNNSTFGQSGSSNSGSTFGGSSGTTTQQPPPAPVTQPSSNP